ncbi:hypothetical protein AB0K92_33200 [Streptomyces sp. NPDC052687]|uniref:hypothetical protein n=1 Tax=Streptomyces sp. NPDC052687 TaxID=3154759 RepID=UPI00343CA475
MIHAAYLLSVLVGVAVLAVALRPRRIPAPTPPHPPAVSPALPATAAGEVRVILAAAAQLAARLDTAA